MTEHGARLALWSREMLVHADLAAVRAVAVELRRRAVPGSRAAAVEPMRAVAVVVARAVLPVATLPGCRHT